MAEKKEKDSSFIEHVLQVRRVTKVTKGGKRFSFSALVVVGDQKGQVGLGLGRSREVSQAITKATNRARKNMCSISLRDTTLPYEAVGNHGASRVEMRSASKGTGVIAGGAVRLVMDALGVKDVLAKSVGSGNRQNVAKATLNALAKLRTVNQLAKLRGVSVEHIIGKKNVSA
jgi:small subunit ribosomal protein S5